MSISHLPQNIQEKLSELVEYILNEVPETQFIILYGSYAKNKGVEYDQRTEFGLRTCFQSDFDIVVLTPQKKGSGDSILRRLDNASSQYKKGYHYTMIPPVHYLYMSVEDFNKEIKRGYYFYTDIIKEGIILFDSGNYKIEPIRELDYPQILCLAKGYYKVKYSNAETRLFVAKTLREHKKYKDASFDLHVATENYLRAALLSATLYAPKTHEVKELLEKINMFTPDIAAVFLSEEKLAEDNRLLNLLQSAYVQSRYNKDFKIKVKDLDNLIEKLERLRVVVKRFCNKAIKEHERKAKENIQ